MDMTLRQRLYLPVILIICLSVVYAADPPSGKAIPAASDNYPNGISVGEPKVFDNRTLTLMLESLSESLRNVQFFDQKTLATALGFIQGFRSSEFVSNLSISTLPTPSVKQEDVSTTGNASTAGAVLPDTTRRTTTTDRAAISPQAPTLDSLPAFSGFTPNYGENASDLLNDQVNLTYQIFNLRMLLERSLSDRLLANDRPRRQAILGFNVTIDPPRTAEDAVAVVEITLNLNPGVENRTGNLSLVSVMPQEKTYNAAALSTKSKAFGGAAVAKMIQVGYGQRQRSQNFYLFRDTDTVSYQRMNGNPNQIVFGWMFRPVLGRRSVSPGLRQLFAILALPADDKLDEKVEDRGKAISEKLKASVKTYWKKYDHDTMTSFEERDANRAARFRYGISLNLTKPEIFNSRYLNKADYNNIEVKSTEDYQNDLRPEVIGVSWRPVGSKSILISAEGNNFFSETKVTIGDRTYANSTDGLILKSNQSFDLTTSIDALAKGPGAIIGRYGPAVPLTVRESSSNAPSGGIMIDRMELNPTMAGNRLLRIFLKNLTSNAPYDLRSLPQDLSWGQAIPIVTFNANVVPPPYKFISQTDTAGSVTALILECNIPESSVPNDGGLVRVSYPFLPEKWTATKVTDNPAMDFQITRLSGSKTILIQKRDILGFTKDLTNPEATQTNYCWQLFTGEQSIKLKTDACPGGDAGTKGLSRNAVSVTLGSDLPEKIILIHPTTNAVFVLDVPKAAPTEPAAPKPIALNQYDAVWVSIPVTDATKVDSLEANQLKLRFRVHPPAKEGAIAKMIQVQVTKELTAKPGEIDLTLLDKDGKPISVVRLRILCQNCTDDGGKQ